MPSLLVIDDEPDMRELITLAVEMVTSWTVHTASGADDALALVAAESYDGMVLDMMMPRMDGVELLTEIRRVPRAAGVPAIFLSGQTHAPSDDVLRSLGVAGTIRKPFDPRTLAGELAQMFGWEL